MRIILQRVSKAQVEIESQTVAQIEKGFLILLGIEDGDDKQDADWLLQKITQMRVFSDADGKMNLPISEVNGKVLVVSQFTLYASTKKGNRPSFIRAARPDKAVPMYEYFIETLRQNNIEVATGEFGADMQISLTNDGPVTIILDSKNRE